MNLYEQLLRPLLFRMDPEKVHERAIGALEKAGKISPIKRLMTRLWQFSDPMLETEVAGLKFPNPVGLAAGFDKNARAARALPALGFGFIEVGTVTLRPQFGNSLPRLARIPDAQALLNRLGFNNEGAPKMAARLEALNDRPVPIGVNIGINADADKDDAPKIYAECLAALYAHGDYFAVNISSPNTKGLRQLQDKLRLERLLIALRDVNPDRKPIFVKLSPDLERETLLKLLPVIERNAQGIIAANTTIDEGLKHDAIGDPARLPFEGGGLSGRPVRDRSTDMIREIYKETQGRLPIIGVGGIFNARDAYQKIRAGASLVQVYTGFVYRGPRAAADINRGLLSLLREHQLASIREAVGRSHQTAGVE